MEGATRASDGSRRPLSWADPGGFGFVDASKLRPTISNELVISADICNWGDPGPIGYSIASLLGKRRDSLWLEEPDGANPRNRFPHGIALPAPGGGHVTRIWSALSPSRLHFLRS